VKDVTIIGKLRQIYGLIVLHIDHNSNINKNGHDNDNIMDIVDYNQQNKNNLIDIDFLTFHEYEPKNIKDII